MDEEIKEKFGIFSSKDKTKQKKWLLECSNNPHKENITSYLKDTRIVLGKTCQ